MKRIKQSGPLHAAYFLIETDGEYEEAILNYLNDNCIHPEQWGMNDQFSLDELVLNHRINGNRQSREHDYPYILVINLDDEYGRLLVNFVPKVWFD